METMFQAMWLHPTAEELRLTKSLYRAPPDVMSMIAVCQEEFWSAALRVVPASVP
jgi:hypothetical protein